MKNCIVVFLFLLCGLPGCALFPSAASSASKSTEQARLYGNALSDEPLEQLNRMAQDKLGLHVQSLSMDTVEMLARVTAESPNPQNDVNFGTDSFNHVAMADLGLLEPYKGPGWQALPANLKDPNGYWAGLFIGVVAFGYRPERLQVLGVEPPASWHDLLNPKLKGEIVLPDPTTSGTAYTILYTLVSLYGEDEGIRYMHDLDRNVAYYAKGGSEPAEVVANGKYAVGITFAYYFQMQADRGKAVRVSLPEEGTGWELGAISIVKGAKHMDAAKRFVDLALSSDAQALFPLKDHRAPVLQRVAVPEGTFTLSNCKFLALDRQKMVIERRKLTQRWRNEIGVGTKSP
jgi:iron(III) transport system substrate-binding protein